MANEHNFVFCATDWSGMSTQDLPNIAAILGDLSHFPSLADRVQQGFVNFIYLGRLMIHPHGFRATPAFQVSRARPRPVIDTGRLFYDGNSQGGILGGSLTALAPDFNRAVLGVPGDELLDPAAPQRRLRPLRGSSSTRTTRTSSSGR